MLLENTIKLAGCFGKRGIFTNQSSEGGLNSSACCPTALPSTVCVASVMVALSPMYFLYSNNAIFFYIYCWQFYKSASCLPSLLQLHMGQKALGTFMR